MDEQSLHQLKKIYELEKFQIAYYESQLSSMEDKFYHKAFTLIVRTKKKHADFIAKKLVEAGIEIPKVVGTLADIAGNVVGESLELTGPTNTCRIGVALESKGLTEYHELINHLKGEPELQDWLMEFMLEEEFYALWLNNYAKRLKQKESQKSLLVNEVEEHPTLNINMHLL